MLDQRFLNGQFEKLGELPAHKQVRRALWTPMDVTDTL